MKSLSLYAAAAKYAFAGSWGEGSTTLMMLSGRSSGVTLAHVSPPSRVRWTKPSSEPTQITPSRSGDSSMLKTLL